MVETGLGRPRATRLLVPYPTPELVLEEVVRRRRRGEVADW